MGYTYKVSLRNELRALQSWAGVSTRPKVCTLHTAYQDAIDAGADYRYRQRYRLQQSRSRIPCCTVQRGREGVYTVLVHPEKSNAEEAEHSECEENK